MYIHTYTRTHTYILCGKQAYSRPAQGKLMKQFGPNILRCCLFHCIYTYIQTHTPTWKKVGTCHERHSYAHIPCPGAFRIPCPDSRTMIPCLAFRKWRNLGTGFRIRLQDRRGIGGSCHGPILEFCALGLRKGLMRTSIDSLLEPPIVLFLYLGLKPQLNHLGPKRLSRTVARLLMIADPLVG